MKSSLTIIAKLLISVGLLVWLFKKLDVDWANLIAQWQQLQWKWIALALLAQVTMLFLGFVRWQILLRAQNIRLDWRHLSAVGFIGIFFANFSVGLVGADVARVYYAIQHHPENKPAVVLSILADRLFGLFGLCLVAFFVLPLNWTFLTSTRETSLIVWTTVGMVVLGLVGLGVAILLESSGPWKKLFAWKDRLPFSEQRKKIGHTAFIYLQKWDQTLFAMFISIFIHFFIIAGAYCLAQALSLPISFLFVAGMLPIVGIATSIPITISGFGVREGLLALFFKTLGMDATTAFTYSFTLFGLNLVPALFGGLVYLFYRVPPKTMAATLNKN